MPGQGPQLNPISFRSTTFLERAVDKLYLGGLFVSGGILRVTPRVGAFGSHLVESTYTGCAIRE